MNNERYVGTDIKEEIDRLNNQINENIKQMAIPKIFIPSNSEIEINEHIIKQQPGMIQYISSNIMQVQNNNLQLKIKKLHPDATTPSYAKNGDAAIDLTAINVEHNKQLKYYEYSTGLAFEIPQGYVGLIFPRSSISNKDMYLTNAVGVIDSGYRGEIKFRFKTHEMWPQTYSVGEKIGQMIIMPFPQIELVEVQELSDSDRGIGGFGSSGS